MRQLHTHTHTHRISMVPKSKRIICKMSIMCDKALKQMQKQIIVFSHSTCFMSLCDWFCLSSRKCNFKAFLRQQRPPLGSVWYAGFSGFNVNRIWGLQCCQCSNFVAKFSNFSNYPSNFFFQKHIATNLAIFYIYLATFINFDVIQTIKRHNLPFKLHKKRKPKMVVHTSQELS